MICNVCHEISCECDENVLHYKKVMEAKLSRAKHALEYLTHWGVDGETIAVAKNALVDIERIQ